MDGTQRISEIVAQLGIKPWMLQVFMVVFFTLLANFIQKRVLNKLAKSLARTKTTWDEAVIGGAAPPSFGIDLDHRPHFRHRHHSTGGFRRYFRSSGAAARSGSNRGDCLVSGEPGFW